MIVRNTEYDGKEVGKLGSLIERDVPVRLGIVMTDLVLEMKRNLILGI